jgi:RNA polymerase sigma-70 factor (ECF subfamily)
MIHLLTAVGKNRCPSKFGGRYRRSRSRKEGGESDMKAEAVEVVVSAPRENGTRNSEEISDEAVITRVRTGEPELFEVIMRRYNQRLYRVARSIVRNEAEAEDVVQDAYVRAYTHLSQYAGEAKFSTWLTRIAVNEGLRRLRKRGRFDDMQRMASTMPVAAEGPDRAASDREVRDIMESAIEGLPSAYRSIVMLRDVEDLSTAEAADCLGIPPATVKTRLHRGHALLRETLGSTLGATRPELFTFGFSRCDRVVRLVLQRIGAKPGCDPGRCVELRRGR